MDGFGHTDQAHAIVGGRQVTLQLEAFINVQRALTFVDVILSDILTVACLGLKFTTYQCCSPP